MLFLFHQESFIAFYRSSTFDKGILLISLNMQISGGTVAVVVNIAHARHCLQFSYVSSLSQRLCIAFTRERSGQVYLTKLKEILGLKFKFNYRWDFRSTKMAPFSLFTSQYATVTSDANHVFLGGVTVNCFSNTVAIV